MTTLRLCARGLSAFLVVALISVSGHGTVWQWSSDAPPGYEPPPYNLTEGRIEEYEGIDRADFPTISSGKHLKAIVGMEYNLTASRASGDIDKKVDTQGCAAPVFVADELKTLEDGWPKWWKVHGEFKDEEDGGLSVTWIAPDEETTFQYPAAIALYEDDKPLSVPTGDTGSRDDEALAGYGCMQHSILIDVLKPEVVFRARVVGDTTNDTSTYGTNSRDKLGLWRGAYWNDWCNHWSTNHALDFANGSAVYLIEYPNEGDGPYGDDNHPKATGTALKCEMYAKIENGYLFDADATDAALLPASSRQRLFTPARWRIRQDKKKKWWRREYVDGTAGPLELNLMLEDSSWVLDGTYLDEHPDAMFDPQYHHLYLGDVPGTSASADEYNLKSGESILRELILRDRVQLSVRGSAAEENEQWLTLREFPANEEPDWEVFRYEIKKDGSGYKIVTPALGQSFTTEPE